MSKLRIGGPHQDYLVLDVLGYNAEDPDDLNIVCELSVSPFYCRLHEKLGVYEVPRLKAMFESPDGPGWPGSRAKFESCFDWLRLEIEPDENQLRIHGCVTAGKCERHWLEFTLCIEQLEIPGILQSLLKIARQFPERLVS